MKNIRIERLNHTYQEEISMIIMREVKDELLKTITITGVDTTSDLSICKVYYTSLNLNKKQQVKEALQKASPFIRTKLAEKINIRHTPELRFIYDESISYGEHIEKIIDEINHKN